MATLKIDTRRKLYETLEVLDDEQLGGVEVRTVAGKSPELVVGPTGHFEELHNLGDIPGITRSSLEGSSFGGWKATYFVADTGVLLALREYLPYDQRVEAAVRFFRSARQNNPRLDLSGGEKSALWAVGFSSSEEAGNFCESLDRLAFKAQQAGLAVTIESPELNRPLLNETPTPQDNVNHPSHYASESGMEAIEVIEAYFHGNAFLANTFKYIARAGKKGGEAKRLEDLKKARWYLEREIKLEEAREDS
nr:MAG TPA: nucelotide kinase [Caudoviricetes sp.]